MSSTAPWWALPVTSLVSVFISQAWTLWTARLRRREERADRWEPEKMDLLFELTRTGDRLLALRVWPEDRTTAPTPARPYAETLEELTARYAVRAPAPVAELARVAAERGSELAVEIEDIRAATARGPHGAVEDAARERHELASDRFAGALDQLTVAARRDLGVKAPYAPRRRR